MLKDSSAFILYISALCFEVDYVLRTYYSNRNRRILLERSYYFNSSYVYQHKFLCLPVLILVLFLRLNAEKAGICLCSDQAGTVWGVTWCFFLGLSFRKAVLCTQTVQPSEHPLASIREYWAVSGGVSVWSQLLIGFILALYLEIAR